MENFLILNELGDLMLLEIINEKWKVQSEQFSASIATIKEMTPQMDKYEEKKNILVELINGEKLDEENYLFLKNKFVRKNFLIQFKKFFPLKTNQKYFS